MKISTKQFQRLHNLITRNANMFERGNTFTEQELCDLFDYAIPSLAARTASEAHLIARKHSQQLRAMYCSLNDVLEYEGKVIRSKNNGQEYHVETIPGTDAQITRLTSAGRQKFARAARLQQRLINPQFYRPHPNS